MAAKKVSKKVTAKKAVKKVAAKKVSAAKTPAGKRTVKRTARQIEAAEDTVADAVIAAVDKSTGVEPIILDSTLGSLGISSKAQLEALAGEICARIPGLKLRGKDLKASNTIREVIAIVKKKMG